MVKTIEKKQTATSYAEKVLAFYLKKAGLNIKENVSASDIITKNKIIAKKKNFDMYFEVKNKKFVVEFDGFYYHKDTVDNDIIKNLLCKQNNIIIIRIRDYGLCSLNDYSYDYILAKRNSEEEYEKALFFIKDILERVYKIKLKDYNINLEKDRAQIYGLMNLKIEYNSISNVRPDFLLEWDYDKNIISPDTISFMSHKQVWWKCPLGHSWQARPMNRVNGNGCPYCANRKLLKGFNDFKTLYPKLAKMWYPENIIHLDEILGKSEKKLLWQCQSCGHIFERKAYKMVQTNGKCPECGKETK